MGCVTRRVVARAQVGVLWVDCVKAVSWRACTENLELHGHDKETAPIGSFTVLGCKHGCLIVVVALSETFCLVLSCLGASRLGS